MTKSYQELHTLCIQGTYKANPFFLVSEGSSFFDLNGNLSACISDLGLKEKKKNQDFSSASSEMNWKMPLWVNFGSSTCFVSIVSFTSCDIYNKSTKNIQKEEKFSNSKKIETFYSENVNTVWKIIRSQT